MRFLRLGYLRWTVLVFALSVSAAAQHSISTVKPNTDFDKMRSLVGDWEGSFNQGGQAMKAVVRVYVVSDGSAIMHTIDPGGPHEMITIFHTDGSDPLATRYCAAHNQPRMKLVAKNDAHALLLDFKDGSHIAPGDGHRRSVKFIFVDADHHDEDWSFNDNGKISTTRFEFHRKKA